MPAPNVNIVKTNGNLGRIAPSEDGISGLIVSGVAVAGPDGFALGDVLGPFNELRDAENKGIDEAYDTTNQCLAWHHIRDFFRDAPKGTDLWLMVLDPAITMTEICDETNQYAAKLLNAAGGKIKLIGITRVPDAGYTPTFTGEFEDDLWQAMLNADELADSEFDHFRPVDFILEARNWQGDVGLTRDLRDPSTTPATQSVSVIFGNDQETMAVGVWATNYASVGIYLGSASACQVNRSVARVKNGPIKPVLVGFSNGAAFDTLTEADIDTMNDKGYVFFKNHVGKAGYFFNDNPTGTEITDDYFSQDHSRVMNKAARITRIVLLELLNDEIPVDADTGLLPLPVIKNIQGLVDKAINDQMTAKGEISGAETFIDPLQNLLSADELNVELDLIPTGTARHITATLGFRNPLNT